MRFLFLLFALCLIHTTIFSQTVEQLDSQVVALYQNEEFEKALPLAEKAVDIINNNGGEKHPGYLNAVEHLGILYKKIKNYEKAKIPYQLLLINKKLKYGEISEEYALSQNQIAILYDMLQQNDTAINLYKNGIKIFNKLNNHSENYYIIVDNLAAVYKRTGDFVNAISNYKLTSENNRKLLGDTSIDYALSQNDIGLLYSELKHHDTAILFFKQALNIYEKGNVNSISYLNILQNLAISHKKKGDFNEAERLFTALAEKVEKKYGKGKEYASALNQLGTFYIEEQMYAQAQLHYSEALNIYTSVAGENDATYLMYASDVSLVYHWMGQYDKAEQLLLKILDKTKILSGENLDFAATANSLAQIYVLKSDYSKAEFYYLKVKEIKKALLGEDNLNYASILNNLAALYFRTGKYNEAKRYYKQAIQICEKLNTYARDYADFTQNLAALYEHLDNHTEAESLYVKSLKIIEKLYGAAHPSYLNTLNNLAAVYRRMGQYTKAEGLYIKIIESRKKILGDQHPDYATSLQDLGNVYEDIGNFKQAEIFYLQSLNIVKLSLGENHPDYATILDVLGSFYGKLGQYSKAESLLITSAEIKKQKFGENNDQYSISLNKLASLYESLGQTAKAEKFYQQALMIDKNIFGEEHTNYSTILNNLAILYESLGEYEKAESMQNQALQIKKKIYGEQHPSYILGLGNLGALYESMGQTDKAEALYIKVAEARKKIFGEDNIDYALSLYRLSLLYLSAGKYDKAEPLLLKSVAIRKEKLGELNEDYARALRNLGGLYMNMKQFSKAEPLLLASVKIDFSNLFSAFTIMSQKDKEAFIYKNSFTSEQLNSFLVANPSSAALAKNNYNTQLILKSLSLVDTRSMIGAIQNNKDAITKNLFVAWQNNKALLSKQYSLPADKRFGALDSIENATENLEKKLNKKSLAFRNQTALQNTTFTDVKNKLQQNEAAIEFVRFNYYINRWTDTIFYAAYILRKNDSVPIFIPLCEEKQLEQLFASAGKTTTVSVTSFYRGVEDTDGDNVSVAKGDSLYKLIWQPLEPYLKGINKISYSPAGKLYTIAFNALPAGDGKILMDKYKLQQYTSTRQIAFRSAENKNTTPKSIALFGDATFTLDSLQLVKSLQADAKNATVSTNIYTPQTRGSNNAVWSNLPGTATEVNKIQNLFSQNKIAAKTFVQQQASEEKFKALSGNSPQVLHLATHGFFLPEADKKRKDLNEGNVYSLAEDPLMRSGILLSGANYAWSGKTPINGVEDGIATAYEISQLDLSKTDLVVLSACETALGDIKGSEGVFGLQRSFKMAGVNKLIVSLWQVPDKETAELMTIFYSNWLGGKTIENAFYTAQSEMRKKYAPFYWAAFVLVE